VIEIRSAVFLTRARNRTRKQCGNSANTANSSKRCRQNKIQTENGALADHWRGFFLVHPPNFSASARISPQRTCRPIRRDPHILVQTDEPVVSSNRAKSRQRRGIVLIEPPRGPLGGIHMVRRRGQQTGYVHRQGKSWYLAYREDALDTDGKIVRVRRNQKIADAKE
jgi:hypothetical protein